jgi:hypothetical protein
MTHEPPAPLALKDCWTEFERLLRTIETLYGDLFDAPGLILRTAARRAEAWLRDGEAVARALLLALAAAIAVVLKPTRSTVRRTIPRKTRDWRFAFVTRLARNGRTNVRYALSPAQKQRLDDQRREDGYRRRMFNFVRTPTRLITTTTRRSGAPLTLLPPRADASRFVDRRGLVRRFNGLIHVMQSRDAFARRLAHRLARRRDITIARALARPARHPDAPPSPYDWLVVEAQAHAPRPRLDSS